MQKFLIFKVNDVRLGVKSNQVVNILKNVKLNVRGKNKPVETVDIWGVSVPVISLHQIFTDIEKTEVSLVHVLLVEIATEPGKKEIIGLTFDEIEDVCLLDNILSYPFQFQTCAVNYKDMIIVHRNKPLTILNVCQLWKTCQGNRIFSGFYLAN